MKGLHRIRLGQHYAVPSPVHRLDARSKLLCALALLVGAFAIRGAAGILVLAFFSLLVIYLAKLPPRQVLAGLRSVLVLLVITALVQLLFSPGRVLWRWGPFSITNTGVENGVVFTMRLALAVILLVILTMTTGPVELLGGMEYFLSPLGKLGFPVRETAMILATAFRFLPVMLGRAGEIAKAQEARGADFSSGNPLRRARSLLPLFIPLFNSCFRDAEELGAAMAARGYRGGAGRTSHRTARPGLPDAVALIIVGAVLALASLVPA
ncbi:MAG: energy-coupling factor transporter transmembrane protein EcfT [Actinobacteria bacterium]|nr:energy-coupling factor transporter transmembrane protein EcfT [Actinomycetota bacterium]